MLLSQQPQGAPINLVGRKLHFFSARASGRS
jgi:hypothetical protein